MVPMVAPELPIYLPFHPQRNVHVWVAARAASVTLRALTGATSIWSLPLTLGKMAQVASSSWSNRSSIR